MWMLWFIFSKGVYEKWRIAHSGSVSMKMRDNGKLIGLVCSSGHVTVPPRSTCQSCSSEVLEEIQLSGKGKVVSFTEVFVKSKEFPIETPYVLALVRLLEGGKLLGVLDEEIWFRT